MRRLRRSTLRCYQEAVRTFCTYLTDPAYGWMADCSARFGSYPIQVCHEWNTAAHVQDAEADAGKRAFTRGELQVTPADLIATSAENVALRKAAGTAASEFDRMPVDLSAIRPKRARVRPET